MVKVQKPIPKTIKKSGPELKKSQIKKIKTKSTKDVAKNAKKTLEELVKNEEKDVRLQSSNLHKKAKKVQEKVIDTAPKKKPIVAQVQKSLKNGVPKKKSLQEVPEPVKKVVSKKSAILTKVQKPTKNVGRENVEKISKIEQSVPQKRKLLEPKVQLSAKKKTVVKKESALEGESETVKKDHPRKKQFEAKVQQPVKKHDSKTDSKKKFVLEEELETVKRVFAKKKTIKAKVQNSVEKDDVEKVPALVVMSNIVEKVGRNKKITKAKEQGAVQKNERNPETFKKTGHKVLASKVQKKVSAVKKTKNNLKKVKTNVRDNKKILQDKQIENEKYEKAESPMYESINFDEDTFKDVVSLNNITKICIAFKELLEKNAAEKRSLVFRDYHYLLNVASYKIPNCPKRMVKLNLKHALVDVETDDVVLIVPDLKIGSKVDYEPTIQHYEDLLRENGVENIKIMSFNQLRNEYSSFEAKRKLSNTYDHFLCDGRIVSHVVGFCGKHFQKPRTTIHAVRLDKAKTCKSAIDHAIRRTSYRQLQKGDLISIPVGSHLFTANQLAENIVKVIDQLKTIFPGGYANMRNIHIKTDIKGLSSLPLYVSLAGAPDEVPNVIGPREQKMLKLKKEANDILAKFSMSKSGEFVKLNKAQVKRKQDIREAREALSSKENVEVIENESEFNAPLKKKPKKQVEPRKTDDSEECDEDDDEVNNEDELAREGETKVNGEDQEASEEDSYVNDEDEEASEEGSDGSDE